MCIMACIVSGISIPKGLVQVAALMPSGAINVVQTPSRVVEEMSTKYTSLSEEALFSYLKLAPCQIEAGGEGTCRAEPSTAADLATLSPSLRQPSCGTEKPLVPLRIHETQVLSRLLSFLALFSYGVF